VPRFVNPPDREAFFEEVWAVTSRIPAGRVATYGQLAKLAGRPEGMEDGAFRAFGPRWVGGAMAHCPDGVPWYRVVNAQGKISDRPGSERQRPLLEEEGVEFDDRGRIDLARFGWQEKA
jgi:methylated-DNA-protein-cysteine methyltransferase-like protein